jgi:hypothetical protein
MVNILIVNSDLNLVTFLIFILVVGFAFVGLRFLVEGKDVLLGIDGTEER